LVAQISEFLFQNDGNIVHADNHIDAGTGLFLMRVEWELDGFSDPSRGNRRAICTARGTV